MSLRARDELLAVFRATMPLIDAGHLLRSALEQSTLTEDLSTASHAYVIAVGKAAPQMLLAFMELYGDDVTDAVAISEVPADVEKARCLVSSHPFPSSESCAASRAIRALLERLQSPRDLLVVLISGGASALIAEPLAPLELEDLAQISELLLFSGIDVTQVNSVRRSLTTLHGGRFAELASPARVRTFILCDNAQVGASAVGSGLTYPWSPSAEQVVDIVHGCVNDASLVKRVKTAMLTDIYPKRRADTVVNTVIGDPHTAVSAACRIAEARGLRAVRLPTLVTGEARYVAHNVARRVQALVNAKSERPLCIIGGGEVTVRVRGPGLGGRCQELAWSMLPTFVNTVRDATFAALATDGRDFATGLAGAIVDRDVYERARLLNRTWEAVLEENDTGTALLQLEATVAGWNATTNLCDLYMFLSEA